MRTYLGITMHMPIFGNYKAARIMTVLSQNCQRRGQIPLPYIQIYFQVQDGIYNILNKDKKYYQSFRKSELYYRCITELDLNQVKRVVELIRSHHVSHTINVLTQGPMDTASLGTWIRAPGFNPSRLFRQFCFLNPSHIIAAQL